VSPGTATPPGSVPGSPLTDVGGDDGEGAEVGLGHALRQGAGVVLEVLQQPGRAPLRLLDQLPVPLVAGVQQGTAHPQQVLPAPAGVGSSAGRPAPSLLHRPTREGAHHPGVRPPPPAYAPPLQLTAWRGHPGTFQKAAHHPGVQPPAPPATRVPITPGSILPHQHPHDGVHHPGTQPPASTPPP